MYCSIHERDNNFLTLEVWFGIKDSDRHAIEYSSEEFVAAKCAYILKIILCEIFNVAHKHLANPIYLVGSGCQTKPLLFSTIKYYLFQVI